MKKILLVVLIVIMSLQVVACSGDSGLDFRSVLDTETGTIMSLGDARADFDNALGEGIERGNAVSYAGGDISVFFRDGYAVEITLYSSDRFELRYASFNMSDEEIQENFTEYFEGSDRSFIGFYSYQKDFDADGNEMNEEGEYATFIILEIDDRNITSIGIWIYD